VPVLGKDRAAALDEQPGADRAVAEAGLASAVLPPAELARRIGQRAEVQPWK
jgi:hypothetical protein